MAGLQRIRRRVRRAAAEASRAAAEQTLRRALELVPRRTGALAASGKVVDFPNGVAVVFDAPHAFVVHQSPDLFVASGGDRAAFGVPPCGGVECH